MVGADFVKKETDGRFFFEVKTCVMVSFPAALFYIFYSYCTLILKSEDSQVSRKKQKAVWGLFLQWDFLQTEVHASALIPFPWTRTSLPDWWTYHRFPETPRNPRRYLHFQSQGSWRLRSGDPASWAEAVDQAQRPSPSEKKNARQQSQLDDITATQM